MAVINFDATKYEPFEQGSTKFPLGDYPFTITEVIQQASKQNARSGMLVVTIKVTQGSYQGCTQKVRFNLWNEDQQARDIAARQFSSLCHSIGRVHIADDQQLLGGTGVALIGPQDDNDKYSEVKVWKDNQYRVNGKGDPQPFHQPAAQQTAPAWGDPVKTATAAAATAAATDTPPWAGGAASAPAPSAPATQPPPFGGSSFGNGSAPTAPAAGNDGVPPWLQK